MDSSFETRFAQLVYRLRWPASLVVVAAIVSLFLTGTGRVGEFNQALGALGDTSNGAAGAPPVFFDSRMDVWFGAEDEAVRTYREIEDRFVAEDYIMVTFEHDGPLGVFERESLEAIARLTEGFLGVPGVRHVRSLTSNPWIRFGEIEDAAGSEMGLVISDLVEGAPADLTDDELVERMIAVLGAERVAERLGAERVHAILGPDADFADHIGEPLLLGTILDETGTTTAIQVQVLRPLVDEDALAAAFPPDESGELGEKAKVASTLHSVYSQRAALRGIEHVLRLEKGLAIQTPERAELETWVASIEDEDERTRLALELADPTRNFMANADGEPVRKYFEYDPEPGGGFVDHSHPAEPVAAATGFEPRELSPFEYHVGGVPLFERNFEDVGMSDAKYIGLMFLAIVIVLYIVFRTVIGVIASMSVVFLSVAGMVGAAFAIGDLFNNMTMIAPNMLTAVGIADAVHIVAAWAALRNQHTDKRALIIDVIRRNALPVFLTSVTTAVGFYSLTISEMVPVSMFGYTTGFGTILAYLVSMTVVPALLSLVPIDAMKVRQPRRGSLVRYGWQEGLTRFVFANRARIVAASGVALVLGIAGLIRLRVDSDFRSMFPDDNPVISDFKWIEARLGGVGDLEIVFDGAPSEGAAELALGRADEERLAELRLRTEGLAQGYAEFAPLSPEESAELTALEAREEAWAATRIGVSGEFLAELDRFEARLREEMADPESPLFVVTDFVSPLDILRRMHQVQNENQARFYRVPSEDDVPEELRTGVLTFDEWTEEWLHVPAQSASTLAAQYYLQYENGARPGENLATQMSLDRTKFRMQGRVEQAPSNRMVAAGKLIETIAAEEFPLLGARLEKDEAVQAAGAEGVVGPELDVSGKMLLFARTNRIFTIGFVQSMSIALTIITILIGVLFRSVRLALVSLIPNVLPILLPLAFFGLIGKPLDAPAIFVASVALGVCVDDTIHFFTKFVLARRRGEPIEKAVRYVFESTGLAITITSIVLVLGFGMLVLSDFAPNTMMGTLAASMIALAWVADLLVTPAVLSYVRPVATEADSRVAEIPAPGTRSAARTPRAVRADAAS